LSGLEREKKEKEENNEENEDKLGIHPIPLRGSGAERRHSLSFFSSGDEYWR
jgi:hypothetical protein